MNPSNHFQPRRLFPRDNSTTDDECGSVSNEVTFIGLRVASIFIIAVCSTLSTLFPILSKRVKWLQVPAFLYEYVSVLQLFRTLEFCSFAKYFGSGVIIATAFIHLLAPAIEELNSPCLSAAWLNYPWPLALSMASIFSIFFVELTAFRWGTTKLRNIGIKSYDPHGHAGAHAARLESSRSKSPSIRSLQEPQRHEPLPSLPNDQALDRNPAKKPILPVQVENRSVLDTGMAQVLGIAILEFGVLFHSVLIGLTLAVDEGFKVLFVVLIFHQTFEGLGLGTRLAFLELDKRYKWVPIAGAFLYGMSTPLGIAVGLGVRSTYNPGSTVASLVSGVLDSISSGILLYTGLVELLAHEFLFNPSIHEVSNARLIYASINMLLGAGLMALLGNWA